MKQLFILSLAFLAITGCRKIEMDGEKEIFVVTKEVAPVGVVSRTITLSGKITKDTTLFAKDVNYLSGIVYITKGVTLTIEEGAKVQGKSGLDVASLVITRGAKIIAKGTAEKPIVFTSAAQNPASGDWGGIVLLGTARVNTTLTWKGTAVAGLTSVEGGVNDADLGLGCGLPTQFAKIKKGDVVVSFSVSPRMERLCRHFGLNLVVTPIGFKYICEIMTQGGVLVGGEESGGIAIDGYIPERDGLWIGLTLMEYMAKSGKTLENLIEEVYAVSGPFFYDRWDLHIENDHKARVMEALAAGAYPAFGPYTVQRMETVDGYKCWLTDDEWVMFRASGTEPVLRIYAESNSRSETEAILKAAQSTLYGV